MENHTQSQQQRKGRGTSLITPTFLLCSGRFKRNLRWMDDVRDGVQGLFRVWLSYLQPAEQSVPSSAPSPAQDGWNG